MTLQLWLTLGMFGFVQAGALVTIYINIKIKLKELDMKMIAMENKIKDNQHSFHIHEQQNERMFDKFEKKMDDVHIAINDVKNILISNNQKQ